MPDKRSSNYIWVQNKRNNILITLLLKLSLIVCISNCFLLINLIINCFLPLKNINFLSMAFSNSLIISLLELIGIISFKELKIESNSSLLLFLIGAGSSYYRKKDKLHDSIGQDLIRV